MLRKNRSQLMEMYGQNEAAVNKIIQLKTEQKQIMLDPNLPGDLTFAKCPKHVAKLRHTNSFPTAAHNPQNHHEVQSAGQHDGDH